MYDLDVPSKSNHIQPPFKKWHTSFWMMINPYQNHGGLATNLQKMFLGLPNIVPWILGDFSAVTELDPRNPCNLAFSLLIRAPSPLGFPLVRPKIESLHPRKFNIAPEKDGWKMSFLFRVPIFRGDSLNFRGVSLKEINGSCFF